MNGTYRILENGLVVAESKNLITTAGKKAILKYLARRSGTIAGAIGVGIGSTAANVADKSLEFEVVRTDINGVAPDYTTNSIVFKSSLPTNLAAVISEIGLWSQSETGNYASKILNNFDDTQSIPTALTVGVYDSANVKVGGRGIKVSSAINTTTTASLTGLAMDFSGYSTQDEFAVSSYNTSATQWAIRFKTDSSNYITYTKASPAAGYSIVRFFSGGWTTTGTPNLASITSMDFIVTSPVGSTSSVMFDALRVEDRDLDPDVYTLVSHSIIGSPYTKTYGVPADIEYILDVT